MATRLSTTPSTRDVLHDLMSASAKFIYVIIAVFFVFRTPEVVSLCISSPGYAGLLLIVFLALWSLTRTNSEKLKSAFNAFKRVGLILMIMKQVKDGLDAGLVLPKYPNMDGTVSIVTGADSPIGLSISSLLISCNSTVIMTCSSESSCLSMGAAIAENHPNSSTELVVPMFLNMSDLHSIRQFTDTFLQSYDRLDVLVNHANDFVGGAGGTGKHDDHSVLTTAQGIEASLGTMYLGHFALTKWLTHLLLKPVDSYNEVCHGRTKNKKCAPTAARVVNIASDAFVFGKFHSSLMLTDDGDGDWNGEHTNNCEGRYMGLFPCCPYFSCPNTNGYARAKLANVLHAFEYQRKVDNVLVNNIFLPPAASPTSRITTSVKCGEGSDTCIASQNTVDAAAKEEEEEEEEERVKRALSVLSIDSEDADEYRRIVASSVNPGFIPSTKNKIMRWIFSVCTMRHVDETAHAVMHSIIDDTFLPGSYIDSIKIDHDIFNYRYRGIRKHLKTFPQAKSLPYGQTWENDPPFSLLKFLVRDTNAFIYPRLPEDRIKEDFDGANGLSERLWDVTSTILSNWEKEAATTTSTTSTIDTAAAAVAVANGAHDEGSDRQDYDDKKSVAGDEL